MANETTTHAEHCRTQVKPTPIGIWHASIDRLPPSRALVVVIDKSTGIFHVGYYNNTHAKWSTHDGRHIDVDYWAKQQQENVMTDNTKAPVDENVVDLPNVRINVRDVAHGEFMLITNTNEQAENIQRLIQRWGGMQVTIRPATEALIDAANVRRERIERRNRDEADDKEKLQEIKALLHERGETLEDPKES